MSLSAFHMLLEGAWVCLWISAAAIAIGVPAGLAVAIARAAAIPILDQILALYISLARATPLVTLVLFIFLTSQSFGLNLDKSLSAILALVVNTTAFNAEIWLGALRQFSKGQKEAALAVGLRPLAIFRHILLPQIWQVSLPALINEASSIIKGSPAIAVIGLVELTQVTKRIAAVTYSPLPSIIVAGAMYIVIVFGLTQAQRVFEKNAERLATD